MSIYGLVGYLAIASLCIYHLSLVVKKIKIGEHFAKLQAKKLIDSCALLLLQCPA